MSSFEALMYQGAIQAVGDPIFLGFMVFGFFLGFVVLQGQNLAGKMVILVPASILALAFMPSYVTIILGLILGAFLYFAVNKFMTR